MTLSETRKLGIEFERRVQTMIPEKEYLDKLDTETIYAYLNSYQDKYIHDIYRNLDLIKSGSKMSAHVESVLQEMLRTQTIDINDAKDYTGDITDTNGITIVENGRSVTYPLDPSFYMYVRSVSNVISTYAFKSAEPKSGKQRPIRIIPNELVSLSDVWRLLETPHNTLRILRYPAASIGAYETFTNSDEEIKVTKVLDNDNFSSPKIYTVDKILDDTIISGSIGVQHLSFTVARNVETNFGTLSFAGGSYSSGEIIDLINTPEIRSAVSATIAHYMPRNHNYFFLTIAVHDEGDPGADVYHYQISKVEENLYNSNPIRIQKNLFPDDFENSSDKYYITAEYDETVEYLTYTPSTGTSSYYTFTANESGSGIPKGATVKVIKKASTSSHPTLNVIYDQYTEPVGIKIVYYAQPQRFDLTTSTHCELPMDAFDDLVTGAVDLYVQYVAGAEARKRQIEEAKRQQAKDEDRQNRRKNKDNEED